MRVRLHHEGRTYLIEVPAGARVVMTAGGDCLVYRHGDRTEYLLPPFVVMLARQGAKGLRLIGEERASPG